LFPSPNIIRIIKSRRTRWEGHVASMSKTTNAHKTSVGNHNGKNHLRYLGADEWIILKWILNIKTAQI
jgi:hypothetical protein